MTYEDIFKEKTGIENVASDKPLFEILNVPLKKINDLKIDDLNLSQRAYVCINHHLNHPFETCAPGFVKKDSISELFKMSIEDYRGVLNLGSAAFKEIIEKLYEIAINISSVKG